MADAIRKLYNKFKGKSSRGSALSRSLEFQTEFQNAIITDNDDCAKREGCKIIGWPQQDRGLFTWSYTDTTTGEIKQEILSLGTDLKRVISGKINVEWKSGSTLTYTNVMSSFYLNAATATFLFVITGRLSGVDTTIFSQDCGTGLEGSPVTLSALRTAIRAIGAGIFTPGTDFDATITGATSTPAAFLQHSLSQSLSKGGSVDFTFHDWETVNTTVTNLFAAYQAASLDKDFSLAASLNMQNNLYLTTGYNYLLKYDGQTVYRAGLPKAPTPTSALAGGGSLTGTYRYRIQWEHKDKQGNFVPGRRSELITVTPSAQNVEVTWVPPQPGTGWQTDAAKVSSNQTGVTSSLVVYDTPHTVKAGDVICLLDRTTTPPTLVERTVTSVDTTHINWATATGINVSNNDPVSANLRCRLWRTKNQGTNYYLVGDFPACSLYATQTHTDNLADANLGEEYLEYDKEPDELAVHPRYICSHQGVIVCGPSFTEPNTLWKSTTGYIEAFEASTSSFDLPPSVKGVISGIGSDGAFLYVGKPNSLFLVNGDITIDSFSIEKTGVAAVGISSHNSIADVGMGFIFLSRRGFYIAQGGQVQEIGQPINDSFTTVLPTDSKRFKTQRAQAVFNDVDGRYYCFVPCETGSGVNVYQNDSSRIWVYDVLAAAWSEFSNLQAGGGMTMYNDLLYFNNRSLVAGGGQGYLYKPVESYSTYDFADHHQAIEFNVASGWDSFEEPSVYKDVQRVKVFSLDTNFYSSSFSLIVKAQKDFQETVDVGSKTLSFGTNASPGWGYFRWGLDAWGAVRDLWRAFKLPLDKVFSVRISFYNNTIHERPTLTGWEYELNAKYLTEIRK